MSQVRNLRAMFENKEDKSPPDRGRSPCGSTSSANPVGANGSESPRPLSKVRTNFVAIEKDGRIGLRRDQSGDSSPARRRTSTETDAESTSTFPDKPATTSSDDVSKPVRKLFVSEPVSEPLRPPSETPFPADTEPSPIPGKQLDQEQSSADLAVGSTPQARKRGISTPSSSVKGCRADEPRTGGSTTPSKSSGTMLKRSVPSSKAPAGSQRKTAANGSQTTKTSTEPSKTDDNKSIKKTSDKPGTRQRDPIDGARVMQTPPRPKTNPSTTTRKPQPPKGAGRGDTAFSKLKSKSTTKPAGIASSLTAPTASSGSKGSVASQSLSRQSGGVHHLNATSHSTNRSKSPRASASAPSRIRPNSAISRPKPSVGLPPSKSSELDTDGMKRASHVDEGFLARMMRPTQASSSKTAEKTPSTPPRKLAPRPSTAAAERNPQHVANIRKPTFAKDPASKKPASNSSQQAGSGRTSAVVKHDIPRMEPTGQAISVTQDVSEVRTPPGTEESPSPEDTLHVEPDKREAATPLDADSTESQFRLQNAISPLNSIAEKDMVPETAHVETAEEVIGLAQNTGLIQQPAQPVYMQALPHTSPLVEPASGLNSAHAIEEPLQADILENFTRDEQSPRRSDSSEPVMRTAGIIDDKLEAKELAAAAVEDASKFKAPDAIKAEEIEDDAVTASPEDAVTSCPQDAGKGSPRDAETGSQQDSMTGSPQYTEKGSDQEAVTGSHHNAESQCASQSSAADPALPLEQEKKVGEAGQKI